MGSIKSTSTRTALSIDKEFYEQCKKIAQSENRSFNNWVITILKAYVEENHSNLK